MVRIRLRRVGTKNRPSYRLVVADIRAPRDGAFLDILGHFNPLTDPETIVINEEKALKWLKQGAQPTATAARLLSKLGIMEKPKPSKTSKPPKSSKTSKEKT
jgi:small subunit ribosomal protein S16